MRINKLKKKIKEFDKKIKQGYKVDWKNTRQVGNRTFIAMTRELGENEENCILCGERFTIGETGNELGFCYKCQNSPDFPYDIDAYYNDLDNGKTIFKGFDTMSRGILEKYRKSGY